MTLDGLVDRATEARQEILETALAEKNSDTALKLARMEYLPDYSVGYTFDDYLLTSAAPAPNRPQDHGLTIAFNVPIFFWLHQSEDVNRASYDLEAARDDLGSIRSQTVAAVTAIYRNAGLAYQSAVLYRDYLIPLARQGFEVALVAYQSGQVGYVELAATQQRYYAAQVAYLQSENQFLAQKVALEQTIGAPLSQ
jgi:outer membrane protein TolC